jgi:hypothetical protein
VRIRAFQTRNDLATFSRDQLSIEGEGHLPNEECLPVKREKSSLSNVKSSLGSANNDMEAVLAFDAGPVYITSARKVQKF